MPHKTREATFWLSGGSEGKVSSLKRVNANLFALNLMPVVRETNFQKSDGLSTEFSEVYEKKETIIKTKLSE